MRNKTVLFLTVALLLLANTHLAWAEIDWVEKLPPGWLRSFPSENQIPSASDYPTSGAVYLLDEDVYYIADKIEVRVVIMKIFNRKGHKYAEVTTPYYRNNESMEVRGKTQRRDGTVIELDQKDVHEISLSDDLKKKKFSLPGVEDDCLIHYEIVYESNKFNLSGIRYFQNEEPTILSRFNLVVPKHLEVISYDNPPGILDTVKKHPLNSQSVSLYTFTKRDMPAREIESYMPPYCESLPNLAFTVIATTEDEKLHVSWPNVSRWYYESFEQHFIPTKEMKRLVKNLTKDFDSEIERTERLFYYVQSRFKVDFPSRSIFETPQTIFNRQVGSSAEVSGILYALLNSADIQVTPVLVPDKGMVRNLPQVPMLDWFSHVLLKVEADGQKIWLDPYYATNSINCISDPYQDVDGLLIHPDSGMLVRTPAVSHSENLKVTVSNVHLGSDGDIQCEVREVYSPSRSSPVKNGLRNQTIRERKDGLAKSICRYCPGALLDSCFFDDLYSYGRDFKIYYRFSSSKYVLMTDSLIYLNPKILDRNATAIEFSKPSRIFPIMFDRLFTDVDTINIILPPAYQVADVPENIHLENDFVEFHTKYEMENGSIRYERTLVINELMVPTASHKDVKHFFNQVFTEDQNFIILRKVK